MSLPVISSFEMHSEALRMCGCGTIENSQGGGNDLAVVKHLHLRGNEFIRFCVEREGLMGKSAGGQESGRCSEKGPEMGPRDPKIPLVRPGNKGLRPSFLRTLSARSPENFRGGGQGWFSQPVPEWKRPQTLSPRDEHD